MEARCDETVVEKVRAVATAQWGSAKHGSLNLPLAPPRQRVSCRAVVTRLVVSAGERESMEWQN